MKYIEETETEFPILPAGKYRGEIQKATIHISKEKQKENVKLDIDFYSADGSQKVKLFDYTRTEIDESTAEFTKNKYSRLFKIAYGEALLKERAADDFSLEDLLNNLEGKVVEAKIAVEFNEYQEADANVIKGLLVPCEEKLQTSKAEWLNKTDEKPKEDPF